jgi:hypothetical protein
MTTPDYKALCSQLLQDDFDLWQQMREAGLQAQPVGAQLHPTVNAAKLRAVAAWIEDQHDARQVVHTAWEAAQWLRAEAEKAEKSDG